MPASAQRILTTHAGSLPRPPGLLQMMFDRGAGKAVEETVFEARIRSAVDEIVRKQREIGLDLVSDGEMSKSGFSTYIYERLTGFSGQGQFYANDVADFPDLAMRLFATPSAALIVMPNCEGAIEPRGQQAVERDVANLKAALGDDISSGFIPAATPGQITFNFANKYYASHRAYLEAAAAAMKPEYEAIAASGLGLQLDSPDLAMAGHSGSVGSDLGNLTDHIEQAIGVLNDVTRAIPPEQMRLHVCWGNYAGPHHKDVPLQDIIRPILHTRAQSIYVEAANPRHAHEWEVWKDIKLPADKVLIIGAVDVLTNHIEHPRLVAQRIERFAEIVGRERVIAGTDCGFGTFAGWSACDPAVAWLKLQTLVDGAQEASRALFSAGGSTRRAFRRVATVSVLFAPTRATHTTLECRDVAQSMRFYREVMGLPTVRRLKMAAVFRASNGVIAASVQVPRLAPQPLHNFYARPVADRATVDRVYATVLAAQEDYGIQRVTPPGVEDVTQFGVGTYGFYVLDLDGNWWRVEENAGPFGPMDLPVDGEPAGALVPAGPISYVTLESVDIAESVRFFREFLGLDAESHGHYFSSRGNGGVNVIGIQVPMMEYPQPLLNHHGITLDTGREELIDGLRKSAEANASAFGVMKILPATYQHGSYSFYMQDRDTNWWEIEILEELDPYEQTLKDGEWSPETAAEHGARFARTSR